MNTYMTRKEAAEYLGISERTVDRIIRRKGFGEILKIGRSIRISKKKLDNYLSKQERIL